MKKYIYLFLVFAMVLMGACKQKSVPAFKADNFSTGKAGEMILAIDTSYWTPAARTRIYQVLQQPQPAINQVEPMFDIIQCSNKDFLASFTRHRNIVQFDYNPNYSQNFLDLKRDPYTKPQIQAVIRGNNQDSLLAIFLEHQDEIVEAMYENDIARLQNAHRKLNNPNVEKKIKEKFGLTMTIPDGYFVGREEEDFLWLCFRTPKNDRFIMIYKSPAYELTTENIVYERNRITKAYIQGAVQGAYPIVADLEGFPLMREYKLHYHNGIELRGLWASVRDKMGGPFYSYTMLSPDQSSCITVDGFVYAPQEKKRDYLREVESIVKSIN
ncbi:MAG: DUF4837 family protein [Bacteroidales bacterium]|nr:DUF4837 family protein [Bacteroidales bacterium]